MLYDAIDSKKISLSDNKGTTNACLSEVEGS